MFAVTASAVVAKEGGMLARPATAIGLPAVITSAGAPAAALAAPLPSPIVAKEGGVLDRPATAPTAPGRASEFDVRCAPAALGALFTRGR